MDGRPSHEGRGLKFLRAEPADLGALGRPSHEGRGLKFYYSFFSFQILLSSLSRGTWIEISPMPGLRLMHASSLSRGTWIEILLSGMMWSRSGSRPSHEGRGLKWEYEQRKGDGHMVVPLTRDVD